MSPSPALRLVDPATGEVHDSCPECLVKDDVIGGLERDIRGWAARYAILKREKDQQAREHPDWPIIEALFDLWRRETGHTRSRFDEDSFWQAHALYAKHGWDLCERAIAGAKFDAGSKLQRNGRTKRFDDWELIFRNRSKFEDFCNRAPRDFEPRGLPERFQTKGGSAAA